MNRLRTIKINGKEYTLNFSVRAAELLGEKYGDITEIGKAFETDKITSMLSELLWMLSVLIEQGSTYMKIVEGKDVETLTYEQLSVIIGIKDIIEMQEDIMGAITSGMGQTVEVEPDIKNEITTQDQ